MLCDKAMNVWNMIFSWWGIGPVDAFNLNDMLCHRGGVGMEKDVRLLWQAVLLVVVYHIWKSRNLQVFKAKNESCSRVFREIQIKSFERISRRSKIIILRGKSGLRDLLFVENLQVQHCECCYD